MSCLAWWSSSGKSTLTRHLAWSHAAANQSNSPASSIPLLPGNPLPLRIELRRLTEDRRHHPDYSFLSYATEVMLVLQSQLEEKGGKMGEGVKAHGHRREKSRKRARWRKNTISSARDRTCWQRYLGGSGRTSDEWRRESVLGVICTDS